MIEQVRYLEVKARIRYWEDASICGQEDIFGNLTPFRKNDFWCPIIDLKEGAIEDWPPGLVAYFHYKVCDSGKYWLLDDNKNKIYKWKDFYVPENFLCHGRWGGGQYIILNVNERGLIESWTQPIINESDWARIEPLYRHIKKGTLYRVVCEAAIEKDQSPCIVYRPVEGGIPQVRPKTEFFDGRFELVEED